MILVRLKTRTFSFLFGGLFGACLRAFGARGRVFGARLCVFGAPLRVWCTFSSLMHVLRVFGACKTG